MFTIILFLLILGLLVFVHEFGHFITARLAGMRVHEFALGLPPRILSMYRDPATKKFKCFFGQRPSKMKITDLLTGGELSKEEPLEKLPTTLYSINILPLGGFCKIKGESGEDKNASDSFAFQKAWKRMIVLVAGVAMNFLLAAVLLTVGFMVGIPSDLSAGDDPKAIIVAPPQVIVQQVEKNSPAEEAGIQFGDRIISLNSEAIKTSAQMIEFVRAHGQETIEVIIQRIEVIIQREEERKTFSLTPRPLSATDNTPRLGVLLADLGIMRYPWYIALYKGLVGAGVALVNIFVAFYILLKNLILGHGLVFDVAGPVGIAVMVGQSARLGLQYLISMTAMISLSLAAINILPIPALDGGRVLFIGIEKLFGKRFTQRYEQVAHTVGFVLLMILIVLVTGRDIVGLVR